MPFLSRKVKVAELAVKFFSLVIVRSCSSFLALKNTNMDRLSIESDFYAPTLTGREPKHSLISTLFIYLAGRQPIAKVLGMCGHAQIFISIIKSVVVYMIPIKPVFMGKSQNLPMHKNDMAFCPTGTTHGIKSRFFISSGAPLECIYFFKPVVIYLGKKIARQRDKLHAIHYNKLSEAF